jgi:hypothetical protein
VWDTEGPAITLMSPADGYQSSEFEQQLSWSGLDMLVGLSGYEYEIAQDT